MAGHSPPRRRSSLYDPARDVFTQSDDLDPGVVLEEHSIGQEPNEQKQSERIPPTTAKEPWGAATGDRPLHNQVSSTCFVLDCHVRAWLTK